MFKSSRRFYRQKQRRVSSPMIALLAIPLALIVLEVAMRAIAIVTNQQADIAAYEGEAQIVTAYRLKFFGADRQPYDGFPSRGRLVATRKSLLGYELASNQQTSFWKINEQGFRADAPLPLAKPKGEFRIFVLGGSTAFGQLSSNNRTTFASKLETLLNDRVAQQKSNPERFRPDVLPYFKEEVDKVLARPARIRDGKYRVINAAVPGYASGNELTQLMLQVAAYKPDMLIVVDGYTDLTLPSDQMGADIPGTDDLLENAPHHLYQNITQDISTWVRQLYLIKGTQYWLLRPQQSAAQTNLVTGDQQSLAEQIVSADAEEMKKRFDRYRQNVQQMANYATAAKIPIILALQPEITGRKSKLLAPEQAILQQLGSTYRDRITQGYTALEQQAKQVQQGKPNVRVLNLYGLYADFPGQAFHDTIHLTDEANTVLADQLYTSVTSFLQIQPRPSLEP